MPAPSPPISAPLAARLKTLGEQLRAQRLRLRVSATVAAEASGMSRVTLYRIERGEPSVTMGAYLAVIAAVGLDLDLRLPNDTVAISDPPRERSAALPARIRLDDHPALKRLAWQGQGVDEISPVDALHLYERNWRHIDPADLGSAERALIRTLAEQLSAGRLLV